MEEEEEEDDEDEDDMEVEFGEDGLDVDAVCDVCREGESLVEDVIVACDGCDVPVHQYCYGVAEIPEGDWFCARQVLHLAVATISYHRAGLIYGDATCGLS